MAPVAIPALRNAATKAVFSAAADNFAGSWMGWVDWNAWHYPPPRPSCTRPNPTAVNYTVVVEPFDDYTSTGDQSKHQNCKQHLHWHTCLAYTFHHERQHRKVPIFCCSTDGRHLPTVWMTLHSPGRGRSSALLVTTAEKKTQNIHSSPIVLLCIA